MDNSNTKQKLIIQIVCLMLSIGLWFYVTNTENPLIVIDINKVPVKIINSDILKESNLALVPEQELYINLKVEGLSQDLRKVKREDFELNIDLSGYAFKKGENKIGVNIVDYPSKINIKNSNNLTVKVYIEEYVKKEYPIQSDIMIVAKPNYYVAPPTFSPKVVNVSGPQTLVAKVESIVAVGQEANISETIINKYNIEPRDSEGNIVSGVELSEKSVEGTIKVNEGRTVPINVNTVGNLKEGLRLKNISLGIKEIQISGPEEVINEITQISTEPIDLATITDNSEIEVKLKVPDEVRVYLSQGSVIVKIALEKVVTKEFTVRFNITGLNEGLTIVPKVETIQVKISGYEDEISKVKPEDFKAELNVSENKEPGTYSGIPSVELIGIQLNNPIEVIDKVDYDLVLESEE